MLNHNKLFRSLPPAKQAPIVEAALQALWVDSQGGRCPFCRSKQIEGNDIHVEGDLFLQEMICKDCDRTWTDVAKRTGFRSATEDDGSDLKYATESIIDGLLQEEIKEAVDTCLRKAYLEKQECPYCGCVSITGEPGTVMSATEISQRISCANCSSEWTDVYTLSDADIEVMPDPSDNKWLDWEI